MPRPPRGQLYESILDTVGGTPMVRIRRLIPPEHAPVYAKCEFLNPANSVKERVALSMIEAAERQGKVHRDCVLIEPSSGNTAIALAFVCAARGYRCMLVVPENLGLERRRLLKHLGAEVIVTPAGEGMQGAIKEAERLAAQIDGSCMMRQFSNPANPQAHRETTAEEIWRDTDGKADILVAGVGTGGTLSGVGRAIKQRKPEFRVVAVEPEESPVISQKLAGEPLKPGKHRILGIGPGFIPETLEVGLIDEVVTVSSEDAIQWSRRLAREEGIMAGISSGAAVCAAARVAEREENAGKLIVTVLCSHGERYLATPLIEHPPEAELD